MSEAPNDPHGIDDPLALDGEPSVERLLSDIQRVLGRDQAEGWGAIDDAGSALHKQRAEQARALKKEANVFRDTFMTPAGRKCLAILRERTIDADPYPSEAMLPMDAITALVIAHTAQVKFVRAIFEAIAQAENAEASEDQT